MTSQNEPIPPPQRRRRIGRACDMCRQRKVKCDGAKPKCRGCSLFDHDCTYSDSRSRRTPHKEFNEVLESRLKRIELTVNKLVQTQPTIAQNLLTQLQGLNDPLGDDEYHLLAKLKKEPAKQSLHTNEEGAGNSLTESGDEGLESDMSTLTLEDRNRCKYFGPSSGMYVLNQGKLYKDSSLLDTCVKAPGGSSNLSVEFELLCDPSVDFLTPEMLNQLLGIYFEKSHPFLPLFHKGDFMKRIHNNDRSLAILLNAVLAIACTHSGNSTLYANPAIAGSPGAVFFNRAKNLLDKQYRVSQVTTVQALVLMSMFESDGWLFLGMAIRMAQDIGLHRHLKKPTRSNMDFVEIENRKRAWWGCFVVDRCISAILGRPVSIDENDFDTKLIYTDEEEPINYKNSSLYDSQEHSSPQQTNSDVSLRYFVQLIKLNFIFGRVLKTIYAVRSSSSSKISSILLILSKALYEWKCTLPSEFNYDVQKDDNTPFAEILCTLYYSSLILLHRPFLPKIEQITTLEDQPSLTICTRAANMITFIQNKALQENYTGGILIKMIGMFNTSTVHLFNLFSPLPAIARAARTNLFVNIGILEHYSMFAFGASVCLIFLKDLLNDRKITYNGQGPLTPELMESEIPCLNASKIMALSPERNDSEVLLLLSEQALKHFSHTPGSADNLSRSPVVLSQNGAAPPSNHPDLVEGGFDFTSGAHNFDLADLMYSNVPQNDVNNLGYTTVDQTSMYSNNMQPFMNMTPNNTNVNQSPLFLNSFPMSMDVEEWSTYMDQNMLGNRNVTSINDVNAWSSDTKGDHTLYDKCQV